MRVLWLYGAPGVDIDQLGMCYPAPATDPERHRLKARNLAAVLANFATAGAGLAIVSGVLDPELLSTYARERAGIAITVDEQEALTAAGVGDLSVDTSGKPVAESVAEVQAATNLS